MPRGGRRDGPGGREVAATAERSKSDPSALLPSAWRNSMSFAGNRRRVSDTDGDAVSPN